MKISNLLLVFALLALGCQKDEDSVLVEGGICWVEIDGVFEQLEIDKAPEYLNGGEEGLFNSLNIIYPAEARENGTEGTVELEYQISELGEVDIIEITNDIGSGCGDATKTALEEVTTGISHSPAELDGKAVRVKKELSVRFKLE